jgi:hypothetical protein
VKKFEFGTDSMSTIANSDRSEPDSLDFLQTLRMVKPKIFKYKNIGLGDVGANLDSTRQVIRRDPSKRKDHEKEKTPVQATEVKNQSICSRRGTSCILLQV